MNKSEVKIKEKNPAWKGNGVGYRGIHLWITKNYGQPTTCEHCQTGNLIGHKIHWASKTRIYLRERENWLRLCSKCHGLFDRGWGRSRKKLLNK